MNKELSYWQFAVFSVVSLLGTLLHYLYDWTGQSPIAAVFSGVNESTWEHMKLLYWPLVLVAGIEYFFLKEYKNFWCVKTVGTILGLVLIPILFYTYNGVFGTSPDWVNISIFFISAAIVFMLETKWLKAGAFGCLSQKLCIMVLTVLGFAFAYFSFVPPTLPIFKDPTK